MRFSYQHMAVGLVLTLIVLGFKSNIGDPWNWESPVADVLFDLGESKPEHYLDQPDETWVSKGRELVLEGKTKGSRYISKYFVCASCHNSVREDSNLTQSTPENRLNYAIQNDLPFLQSSTFWGMVNRETWYNDDYVKKYGEMVVKANKSLKESIQLCATVCSAGRRLKENEMNYVLAYFWSLQLKLKDLGLSENEMNRLNQHTSDPAEIQKRIGLLKSRYALKSQATFADPPPNRAEGYGLQGRPELGGELFNRSCKHCHRPHGESDVVFENSKKTFKWFVKHFNDRGPLSLYHIVRYGTYSEAGHAEYMPLYTLEKMSHQQVEDLRAFFELKASE